MKKATSEEVALNFKMKKGFLSPFPNRIDP